MSPSDDRSHPTSMHAERAVNGDEESLAWLIERLTPLLVLQGRVRMGPALAERLEAEDLVQEVWVTALGRLDRVRPRDGRWTAPLLAFLGTMLRHRILEHARRLARRARDGHPIESPEERPERFAARVSGLVTRVARGERRDLVLETLEELPEGDRQVIVYRGIEQLSQKETASLLGCTPNAVAVRYHRALERLRRRLPDSVFEELD